MIEIETTPEIDKFLADESQSCGCSKEQFAVKLLAAYIHRQHPEGKLDHFEIKTHADARAWILSQNPYLYERDRPFTDFRKLAHEEHPY